MWGGIAKAEPGADAALLQHAMSGDGSQREGIRMTVKAYSPDIECPMCGFEKHTVAHKTSDVEGLYYLRHGEEIEIRVGEKLMMTGQGHRIEWYRSWWMLWVFERTRHIYTEASEQMVGIYQPGLRITCERCGHWEDVLALNAETDLMDARE